MPTVRLGETELYFETHGEGPPLLCLAGLASDSQSWLPVIPALAARHRLILPDNRGAGRTRTNGGPINLDGMVADAVALLDHLGIAKADLLGHSMGGFLALLLARDHPSRVGRMVLAGSSIAPSHRNKALLTDLLTLRLSGIDRRLWWRIFFQWMFKPSFFKNEAALDEAARMAVEYPFAQSDADFTAQLLAASERRSLAGIESIAAPTLILCGAHDILFRPEDSIASLSVIPGAVSKVLPDAAHSLHWDDPAGFAAAVLDFLEPSAAA